jgi:hypothetical protein
MAGTSPAMTMNLGVIMKKLALLASLGIGTALLAGCASVESGLQSAVNFINAPATQQAEAELKSGADALVCAVADASGLAETIEQKYAGQSVIGTDGKVYVISATVCTALGGTVAGQGVIP